MKCDDLHDVTATRGAGSTSLQVCKWAAAAASYSGAQVSLTSMHLPDASAPSAPAHSRQRLGSAESQRTQLLEVHLLQPPWYATKPSRHSSHCAGPSGQRVQAGLEQASQRPRMGP